MKPATEEPPADPVYPDIKAELWGEGVLILETLGEPYDRAKRLIGKWLRTRNDHAHVYNAIKFAREQGTRDPISLITAALKVQGPSQPRRSYEQNVADVIRSEKAAIAAAMAGGLQ